MKKNKLLSPNSIDLKNLNASKQIYSGLLNDGYVVLNNHDITIDLLENVIAKWKLFFTNKKKYSYLRTDASDEGYIPINFETASKRVPADLKELYQAHYTGKFPSEVDISSTLELFKQAIKVNERICQMLDSTFPANLFRRKESLVNLIVNSNNHLIRIIHYPPVNENASTERAYEHTDICLFTMVFGALFNGLEFKSFGDQWFQPCINTSEIIIFNSEMIELYTGGYFKAISHRVKSHFNSDRESRFSVPIAFHPLRSSQLHEGLTAGQYLKNRLNEMRYNEYLLDIKEY